MEKWGIFHQKENLREANEFASSFEKQAQGMGVEFQRPRLVEVPGRQFRDWEAKIKAIVSPEVQLVVCILQGQKNAAPLYKDLKKLFINQIPVASQVILAKTMNGKNILSIVTKIII